jgi:arylsulfatase A-like enzyme
VHPWDLHSKEFYLPYQAPEPFFNIFCPGELSNYTGCRKSDLCASKYLRQISDGVVKPPSPAEIAKMMCLYDSNIRYVDHEIGRLLQTLDAEGISDNTIVVVTADHGEHFYEHRTMLHRSLYEETLRVPLIIRVPGGVKGKRVKEVVYQTDLLPTIIDLIGLPKAQNIRGRSFSRALLSESTKPEAPGLRVSHNTSLSTVLRSGSFKYIHNIAQNAASRGVPNEELYDLARDPREQRNLAYSMPDEVASFRAELKREEALSRKLQRDIFRGGEPLEIHPTEAQMEQLRALGYGE